MLSLLFLLLLLLLLLLLPLLTTTTTTTTTTTPTNYYYYYSNYHYHHYYHYHYYYHYCFCFCCCFFCCNTNNCHQTLSSKPIGTKDRVLEVVLMTRRVRETRGHGEGRGEIFRTGGVQVWVTLWGAGTGLVSQMCSPQTSSWNLCPQLPCYATVM